jgi:esterase/lipase superfamily enzyme
LNSSRLWPFSAGFLGLLPVIAAMAQGAPAGPVSGDFCVRVSSFSPGQEFLITRRVTARFTGPPAVDIERLLVERATALNLRPNAALVDDTAAVAEIFSEAGCGAAVALELDITYSAEDVAAVRAQFQRGPGAQTAVKALASSVRASAKPASGPRPVTQDGAQRFDWFRIYYATSREQTGAKESVKAFGSKAAESLTFGFSDVSIPADHRWATLESPSVFKFEWDRKPDRHIALAPAVNTLDTAGWKKELEAKARSFGKPGVLLFVHGYNNTFEQAALRAAQVAYDLAFPGPTVLFSWPSDGGVVPYTRDEEDANIAWRQMATVLDVLTQLGPDVPVYVIAHSMGNRILARGLAKLLQTRPQADRAFRQVVFAAADIGVREFRDLWLNDLKGANPPRYTLYASDGDSPIAISKWVHGETRLGSGGKSVFIIDGLDSIDASAVAGEWFGLGHSYFGDSGTVMSDLFTLFHHGTGPDKRPRLRQVKREGGRFHWEFKP